MSASLSGAFRTADVRSAMYDEAISTFEHIVRRGRPVSEILAADYTLNDHVFFSLVAGVSNPRNGASNLTGGNNLWSYGMSYTGITF